MLIGTFSTVYKAEKLPLAERSHRSVEYNTNGRNGNDSLPNKRRRISPPSQRDRGPRSRLAPIPRKAKPQYVALKKIYVTSSPLRIQNELEILHALRHSPHICPLLTAFRHMDQVVAVLPYFRHLDFRLYYRDFVVSDMRDYFRSLLLALHSVHRAGVIHRDIKPTNFLYDHNRRGGVLVDFGLAEKQGTDWQPCVCLEDRESKKNRYRSWLDYIDWKQSRNSESSINIDSNGNTHQAHGFNQKGTDANVANASTTANGAIAQNTVYQPPLSLGYPKNDPRPARRANRAGTRGFRAPEVLLKCTSQTTKIDLWSTGVILLTMLSRRFPFFNSADDVDAMIEIASIFGRRKMRACAALHGFAFETNIETISDSGFTLEKIVVWASGRQKRRAREGGAGESGKDHGNDDEGRNSRIRQPQQQPQQQSRRRGNATDHHHNNETDNEDDHTNANQDAIAATTTTTTSSSSTKNSTTTTTAHSNSSNSVLTKSECQAIAFLETLLYLDARGRPSAKQALQHDFFVRPELDDGGDDGDEKEDGDGEEDDDDETEKKETKRARKEKEQEKEKERNEENESGNENRNRNETRGKR